MSTFQGRKALVVEDQEMFRDALSFELASMGFAVVGARDGREGYERSVAEPFDVIVSDIRMPNWDGRRFLAELGRAGVTVPPFLFMSGFADLSLQEAYDLGADAFLGKPTDADRLAAAIAVMLAPAESRWRTCRAEPTRCTLQRKFSGWDTADRQGSCAFGRGGAAFTVEAEEIPLRPGERLALAIEFASGPVASLLGTGIVAWKAAASKERLPLIGVEFEFLAEPGRRDLIAQLRLLEPRAHIPARPIPL